MFTLNYVNLSHRTAMLDKEFTDPFELAQWVEQNYPEYTSYQVIVTKPKVETGN